MYVSLSLSLSLILSRSFSRSLSLSLSLSPSLCVYLCTYVHEHLYALDVSLHARTFHCDPEPEKSLEAEPLCFSLIETPS